MRRWTSTSSLIGAPGVGNPAISDHLAQRIVQGAIPQALLPCGLISLDMVAVNAGPKFPGELEDRLHSVLNEVTDSDGHLLLFIDEIHPVVGAGATNGAMDAGNNMQPILGRGELRCIGVTTLHAYRKYIVKDPSLAHRFQQVYLDQPCVEDTISIHRGLRERYELHHGIRIDDSALVKAAIKSDRYIRGPFFSIDLVDVAATKLTMEITAKPIVLAEIDRTVLKWDMGRLSLTNATDIAAKDGMNRQDVDFSLLKDNHMQSIKEENDRQQLEVAARELTEYMSSANSMLRDGGPADDIAEIVSQWTGIPVSKLQQSAREHLLHFDDELHKHVVGHRPVVQAVDEAIQQSRAILSDQHRPCPSPMFLRSTGEGKTELATALATHLFNTEHDVSGLVRALFGYVGYEDGVQSEVFNVSLQILDDGRVMEAARALFRHDLLDSGSEYLVFLPLNQEQIPSTVRLQLDRVP